MKTLLKTALFASAFAFAGHAQAATFAVSLTGNVANFSNSQFNFGGLHFNNFGLGLSGLDSSNAFTVAQGDEINSTVTLDQLYTISTSIVRTDLLQFFFGTGFSGAGTQVTSQFDFYNGATLVNSFSTISSTSNALASFAAVFPPNNGAFTFDSFTNHVVIDILDQPATLDSSSFNYSLVSNAVPEPASWALMIAGFGLVGSAARRRQRTVSVTYA
jgi:PEP-CTERM motif